MRTLSPDEQTYNSSPGRRNGYMQASENENYNSQEFSSSLGQGWDLWKILSLVKKWWWLIGLITISSIAMALVALSRTAPMYKASTLLEVKQNSRNIIDVSDVESITADTEFLTTQVELLQSRTVAEDVVDSLNLISDPFFIDPDNPELSALSREQKRSLATNSLRASLNVSSVPRSRLIKVTYEHGSPVKAAQISNSVTDTFISNSLKQSFNATAYAREFLEDRLLTVKQSLADAERELVGYASDNKIIIIDQSSNQNNAGDLDTMSLVALSSELTLASSERVAAEAIYNAAQETRVTSELVNSQALSNLSSKLTDLKAKYVEMSALFKPNYPEMLELQSRIDLFQREIDRESQRIMDSKLEELKNNYDVILRRENDLKSRINGLKNSVSFLREKSIKYNILKREVEIERSQYEALLQRLKDISVSDEVGSGLVEVVDRAVVPRSPFKPRRGQVLLLTLLLSTALGFALVTLLELIDNKIRTPEDVKVKLQNITLGVVPDVNLEEDEGVEVILQDPQSPIAEAYSSLRTNIQFSGPDGGPRVIQITSTRGGEGKSTSSLGLAARFAGAGEKVLLIDADMRRPTFTETAQTSIGLSGILTSRAEFENEVIATHIENLTLLPSGLNVPNPSEILSSHRFDALIKWGRENFDYVLVDSPPVLGLADAPLLGAKVDATLLVVESNILRAPAVINSIQRLLSSGTMLLGVVLTKYVQPKSTYSYDYSYSYGEPSKKSAKAVKNAKKRKIKITADAID